MVKESLAVLPGAGRPSARAGGAGFSSLPMIVGDSTGLDMVLPPLSLARVLGDSWVVVKEEADDDVSRSPSWDDDVVVIFVKAPVLISFLGTACGV